MVVWAVTIADEGRARPPLYYHDTTTKMSPDWLISFALSRGIGLREESFGEPQTASGRIRIRCLPHTITAERIVPEPIKFNPPTTLDAVAWSRYLAADDYRFSVVQPMALRRLASAQFTPKEYTSLMEFLCDVDDPAYKKEYIVYDSEWEEYEILEEDEIARHEEGVTVIDPFTGYELRDPTRLQVQYRRIRDGA